MNVLEMLSLLQLVTGSLWHQVVSCRDQRLIESVIRNGKYLIAAIYEGAIFYPQACAVMREIIEQRLGNLVVLQFIPKELRPLWPQVIKTAACLMQQPRLPLVAGHYLIPKRPIGQGGYAKVFRSLDVKIGREVAIKQIYRPEVTASQRFQLEINTMCRLKHPHIVPVIDVIEDAKSQYLVMPYLSGGDLQSLLTKPISPSRMIRIIVQILLALDYIHGQDLVHRDVKPGNIIFADDKHAMLADFGIVKDLAKKPATPLTGVGRTVGSSGYMAPEIGIDGSCVSGKADVYSLATIAFQGLYGYHPLEDSTSSPEEILNRSIFTKIELPDNKLVPKALGKIILRALDPQPETRISSSDFLQLIQNWEDPGKKTQRIARVSVGSPPRRLRNLFGLLR